MDEWLWEDTLLLYSFVFLFQQCLPCVPRAKLYRVRTNWGLSGISNRPSRKKTKLHYALLRDSAIIQYEYSSLDYTDNILPGSVIAVEGKVTALKGHPQRVSYAKPLRPRDTIIW